MPVVLVVLFFIALLTMIIGLFLKPKDQTRSSRNQSQYQITPRGRRIVESTVVPHQITSRGRRIVESTVVPTRRPRASGRVAGTVGTNVAPRRSVRSSASVANPGIELNDRVLDRIGPWKVAVPGMILVFLLGMYLLHFLAPHQLVWVPGWFDTNAAPTAVVSPTAQPVYTASKNVVRLNQLSQSQYQSTQEFSTWAYSACSAAAMTEVINSYGHHYRITDILKIESSIHEITPTDGLLEESGIQHTGSKFGFKTTWGHNLSLDQVIARANSGTPVIISFPPATYPGGHIVVVVGGDKSNVKLADSSLNNWTQVTRTRFQQLWRGFSAIMTPA